MSTSTSHIFSSRQYATATALFGRLFPADDDQPGALEIGVLDYVEQLLTGYGYELLDAYRMGLDALEAAARQRWSLSFADCVPDRQDQLIADMERGADEVFPCPDPAGFLDMVIAHTREGLFSDPIYGGNRDLKGWKLLNHPGIWLSNTPEEMMATEPVTKGGRFQSLRDLGDIRFDRLDGAPPVPDEFDPNRGLLPPADEADVILIGMGMMNSTICTRLTDAGLNVVALEAGPYRSRREYAPDELGQAYYARARMGPKFNREVPRWRRHPGEPTRPCTFSLGRMMNGVGGSTFHYGGWLRRFHPHHFRTRSHIRENGWDHLLPEDCTVADWPVTYEELEPYYSQLEWDIGIAGVSHLPKVPRSRPLPMASLHTYRYGEMFREATQRMGMEPYQVPVGVNSEPYAGRPATTYSAWSNGFGTFNDSLWHPAATHVPRALASGHLDLRSDCRVLRILADGEGHVSGVEYMGPTGEVHVQTGRCVILGSYMWENVRLLLLSRDAAHPDGLGNEQGQVGRNIMSKNFTHVLAQFPDRYLNRHCAFASQSFILDDFLDAGFPSGEHGFLGGATISGEPQLLPLAISRLDLPPHIPRWGRAYKEHLQGWQHVGSLRLQSDVMPYTTNYVDLDPHHRDRSGLGMPLLRITYDLGANEHRMAAWMEKKCEEILHEMGGRDSWCGPRFTGVGSSHDLGGIRMGEDPASSVVDANLEVHDTPGLFVFSGGAFPSCPGINPSLTMLALCSRATERMITRLKRGDV